MRRGDFTTIAAHVPRETARLTRLRDMRNSVPRGSSAGGTVGDSQRIGCAITLSGKSLVSGNTAGAGGGIYLVQTGDGFIDAGPLVINGCAQVKDNSPDDIAHRPRYAP